jgi:hypothetical protein
VRQRENLRATVTSTVAAISAAVVALAGIGGLSRADIPAGLVIVLLSALGIALSLKHYEQFDPGLRAGGRVAPKK